MHRGRVTAVVLIVAVPLLAGIAWLLSRAEPDGRGLLIIDVPADVAVSVGGRALRPCTDEFHPHGGCSDKPTPGFARRYRWSVIRGSTVDVVASRGTETTTTSVTAPPTGPTPHLRVDESPLAFHTVGGTTVDEKGTAHFVDNAGRVIGTAGPSEPD